MQSVREMAQNFGQSGFYSTRGDTQGAGLTIEERVCTHTPFHIKIIVITAEAACPPPPFLQTWVFFIKINFFSYL